MGVLSSNSEVTRKAGPIIGASGAVLSVINEVLSRDDNEIKNLLQETIKLQSNVKAKYDRLSFYKNSNNPSDFQNQEIDLLRNMPIPFCPSAAIAEPGSYLARKASGTPILAVRNEDGTVKAFINACKHRGMQVAEGMGCNKKAFVCPYHAWTYDLNGNLKRIPGQEGFPGIEIDETNLYEVDAAEKGGIVYIKQNGKIHKSELENALDFFTKDQELFDTGEVTDNTNWKLITETLLEGYHIRALHKNTFYPYGLDNINLVESYGLNSRVIFPFKRIEKLRNIDPAKRNISGMVTKVYHLFPNVSVSVLSKHTSLTIIEPVSPTRAKLISYLLINNQKDQKEITLEEAKKNGAKIVCIDPRAVSYTHLTLPTNREV